MLAACLLFAGCSGQEPFRVVFHAGFARDEIFRVEQLSCSVQEMAVYTINAYNRYADSLGKSAAASEQDMILETGLAMASQIKAMRLLADELGVTQGEDDAEKAAAAAAAYHAMLTEADLAALHNVTVETIRDMYLDIALADRVYAHAIRNVNPEISDDEARTITVEQIRIARGQDDEGALARIREAQARIAAGEDFANVLPSYNEADAERVSFGKGEGGGIPEEAAFSLETGEVSDILETEDAYYLIRCISSFDREQTRANKVRIVEQRRHEAFGTVYDEFIRDLPVLLNEDAWEAFEIPAEAGSETTAFWSCYHQFFADS